MAGLGFGRATEQPFVSMFRSIARAMLVVAGFAAAGAGMEVHPAHAASQNAVVCQPWSCRA